MTTRMRIPMPLDVTVYDSKTEYFLQFSGIPEAEIFGRKRKFSAFGLRFRPPKFKSEYGRKINFRVFCLHMKETV